jgi:serine/threonine protein phosphatase PrpC
VTELLKEEHKQIKDSKANAQANPTSKPPQSQASSIPVSPIETKPSILPPPNNEPIKPEIQNIIKAPITSPTPMTNLPSPSQVKPASSEDPEKEEEEDDIEASSQNYPGERFRVASAETIGVRKNMEDFIRVVRNFRGKSDEDLFCVFDGHGSRKPAEFSGENLPKTLETYIAKNGEDTVKAMEETFFDVDTRMADWAKESGATACVALIQGVKLTVANVGDTRAVLCRAGKAMRLSFDHKPKVPSEKERIERLGGFVAMGRVNAVLAVSRALGDSQVKNLVTAEPYATVTQLQPEDEFLIIACDGVWDILEDQNAVDLIRNMTDKDAVLAAEELRNGAFNGGSNDNISVVVIFFKP